MTVRTPENICGFKGSLLLEAGKKDDAIISGAFAVYGTLSESIYGYKKWKWVAGCFDESLKNDEQFMVAQHEWDRPLGRKSIPQGKTGAASFGSDGVVLWGKCNPNMQNPYVVGLVSDINAGIIAAGSVGFNILTDDWHLEDGWDIQSLVKCALWECSPVTLPRFESTEGLIQMMPAGLTPDVEANLCRALNRASRDLSWIDQDDKELAKTYRSALEPKLTQRMVASLERHGIGAAPIISVPKAEPANVVEPISNTDCEAQLALWEHMRALRSIEL